MVLSHTCAPAGACDHHGLRSRSPFCRCRPEMSIPFISVEQHGSSLLIKTDNGSFLPGSARCFRLTRIPAPLIIPVTCQFNTSRSACCGASRHCGTDPLSSIFWINAICTLGSDHTDDGSLFLWWLGDNFIAVSCRPHVFLRKGSAAASSDKKSADTGVRGVRQLLVRV
jgi:hypothetical protein